MLALAEGIFLLEAPVFERLTQQSLDRTRTSQVRNLHLFRKLWHDQINMMRLQFHVHCRLSLFIVLAFYQKCFVGSRQAMPFEFLAPMVFYFLLSYSSFQLGATPSQHTVVPFLRIVAESVKLIDSMMTTTPRVMKIIVSLSMTELNHLPSNPLSSFLIEGSSVWV